MTEPHSDPHQELRYWLALLHTPEIGPVMFSELLEHFDHPHAVFAASATGLRGLHRLPETVRKHLATPDWSAVERDLAWEAQPNNTIITLHDPRYPSLLREIPDPPPLLYVHGNAELLSQPQIAVVGSRNPTAGGRDNAIEFARYLSRSGLIVTSGLALGIDAASHEGALMENVPTIAITGTGLDRVYPASHRDLAHRIAERGALVSEFPTGTPPLAGNFPRRNRIISGMSLGVLVVEAAQQSGSLITARLGTEQGREVFAIPGSIHNPLARGCHQLIRQGAKLVETGQDIIEELGPLFAVSMNEAFRPVNVITADTNLLDYKPLLDHLDFEPASIDLLVQRSGLTADRVSSMLLELELRGAVASSGGLYTRRHTKG